MTKQEILSRHALALGEHFEHVQILVTFQDEQTRDTKVMESGVGNWWARQGIARAWINRDEQGDSADLIAKAISAQEGET